MEPRHPMMREFLGFQGLRKDSDDFPARRESGVRQRAYQVRSPATINDTNAAPGQFRTKRLGRIRERGLGAQIPQQKAARRFISEMP